MSTYNLHNILSNHLKILGTLANDENLTEEEIFNKTKVDINLKGTFCLIMIDLIN